LPTLPGVPGVPEYGNGFKGTKELRNMRKFIETEDNMLTWKSFPDQISFFAQQSGTVEQFVI